MHLGYLLVGQVAKKRQISYATLTCFFTYDVSFQQQDQHWIASPFKASVFTIGELSYQRVLCFLIIYGRVNFRTDDVIEMLRVCECAHTCEENLMWMVVTKNL